MLKKSRAFSGFAVDDIRKAKAFYQGTLGLNVWDNPLGPIELHIEGGNKILIYPNPDHVPATDTVLNFPVTDIEVAVDALSKRGVSFERYGGPDTGEKGISHKAGRLTARFKDPAGNILSIIEEDRSDDQN